MAKKYFDIGKAIVEGVGSLFKSKSKSPEEISKVGNVFAKNLVDEFGKDEVREAYRIIDTADKDPQLSKLFYREGESKMDDLVNLLEARYMSSERLHAHPLSFNRRGPGAADRYSKLNETGERLTDMPGGPGDRVLYGKHYGEMSMTRNREGQRVYKNEKPTIFEEGTRITDEGSTIQGEVVDDMVNTSQGQMTRREYEILKAQDENPLLGGITAGKKVKLLDEGNAVQDSLYEKTIADIPLINRMMKETGKTETEIREAIAELANQGYESGSPKLMSAFDDDSIRAFVSNKQAVPGETESFVDDMMEALGEGPRKQMDDLITGMTDESDAILQNMKKMEAEAKAMTEIARAEQTQVGEAIETFNRMMDAGDDPAEALQFLQDALKKTRTKQADGGRVGMFLGGSLIGKGIMEAAKLAQKGIKPFGQKQTYKQKVTKKGVTDDQFKIIFNDQLRRVPDEVYDEPTGKGLHTSLLQAEAILTGQKLGLMTQTQRTKIAKAMRDKVAKQIYDNPVAGLSNDYLEYMDDAVGRIDDIFEIERLGGDLTPKPIFDGKEMIGAQVDFTQLNRLGDKGKDNIIPFKPREKKLKGGLMGLLRRINPRLEKEMVETGPFQTGHRSDIIGDMQQIKNVSRNEGVSLERLDSLYDMVQESPRYNEAMRGAMMKLVDYERFRAILVDDNVKLQRMIKEDPEASEKFIRMLFREGGSKPQFNLGGSVGFKDGGAAYINKATLESIRDMPLRSRGSRMPYVQKMQSDMEKYIRMGKQQGGIISEVANPNLREGADNPNLRQGMLPEEVEEEEKLLQAQLMDPSYNSVTGEYSIGGGLKIGPLQLEAMARGMEGIDPTMQYEGSLDLGNDLMLQGGYYDDAINTIPTGPFAGMGDVEDEIRLSLTKSFANGGTVPPQKGPMSQGMGTLYRSK
jgi:hypothetical protein